MDLNKIIIVRLLGPELSDVSSFVRGLSRSGEDVPVCWGEPPEVVVKCGCCEIVQDICRRFGDAVYSIDGRSMESVLAGHLVAGGFTVSTAESCTGGLVGQMLTSVAGSSEFYAGGVITYSNELKKALLGVPDEMLATYGAVSEQVVSAMASGVLRMTGTDVSMSISGIAGPSGGTDAKPIGTVWFGLASADGVMARLRHFEGNRGEIRRAAAVFGLDLVRRWVIGHSGRNVDFDVAGQRVMN